MTINQFLLIFRCFSLNPKDPNNPLLSVFLSIYTFLSLFFIVALLLYTFTLSDALTDDSLVVVVCAMLTLNVYITDVVVVANAYLAKDQLIHIVHQLDDIDKTISDRFHHSGQLLATIQPRYIKKYIYVVGIMVLCYLYCLFIDRSLDMILAFHPLFIIRARSIQILGFVDLVHSRLSVVNKEMKTVVRLYNSGSWDANTQELSYQNVEALKSIYGKLWSLTLSLNKCFGLSLLFLSVESIAELIINSYITFAAVFSSGVAQSIWQQGVFGTMPALVSFLVTCHTCHRCSAQVK